MPVFWRVQPKGLKVTGHTSGLGAEKVRGLFAFTDPSHLFGTYTWLHVRKHLADYEMLAISGSITEAPDDSEGVVIEPKRVVFRQPLREWIVDNGYERNLKK